MSIDRIRPDLEQLVSLNPIEELLRLVSKPVEYSPEEVTAVLPSIAISGGGLALVSLFLLTDNLLCEVRSTGAKAAWDFDYVAKSTVNNVRFRIGRQEIKEVETVVKVYDVAFVGLHHSIENFTTDITYAGDDLDQWMKRVLTLLPIRLVLP